MLEILQNYFFQAPTFGLNAFWVSQGLIVLALCSDITSYQLKKREHVLIFFVVSSVLISGHLYLLNQATAALIMMIAAIRFFTSIFTTNKKVMLAFMALSTFIAFYLYQSWLDLWLLFAGYLFTIAGFGANDKALRETMACGTIMMILYNLLIFSPAAIVLEIIFLSSNLVGYYRYYIRGAKSLT